MAVIVKVNRSNELGNKLLTACDLIRTGIGKLYELNGVRLQSIGAGDSGATMETMFGITAGGGQACSDRWGALLAMLESGSVDSIKLKDFIDATLPG